MSIMPEYRQITKDDLEKYKLLIVPDIYDELMEQEKIDTDYICLASWLSDTPVGVIIAEPEGSGDINLLSIWIDPVYRRMGIASALLDKMTEVCAALYDYEEGQYGDDVTLKTVYSLSDKYRVPFEEWMKACDFTDFMILKEAHEGEPEICSATAEIHFFRMVG